MNRLHHFRWTIAGESQADTKSSSAASAPPSRRLRLFGVNLDCGPEPGAEPTAMYGYMHQSPYAAVSTYQQQDFLSACKNTSHVQGGAFPNNKWWTLSEALQGCMINAFEHQIIYPLFRVDHFLSGNIDEKDSITRSWSQNVHQLVQFSVIYCSTSTK